MLYCREINWLWSHISGDSPGLVRVCDCGSACTVHVHGSHKKIIKPPTVLNLGY